MSPIAPRRPCSWPAGCPALVANGSRCAEHRRPPFGDNRPTAAQRGYGATWRATRARILARDPLCKVCGQAPSTECDHIVPRHRGGSEDDSNLRGVCRKCHGSKSGAEGGAASR